MVSVLVWSAVDRVLGQTSDNKISIYCFSLMQVRAAIVWPGLCVLVKRHIYPWTIVSVR